MTNLSLISIAVVLAISQQSIVAYEVSQLVCDSILSSNGISQFCDLPAINAKCPSLYGDNCGDRSADKTSNTDNHNANDPSNNDAASQSNSQGQSQQSGSFCANLLIQIGAAEFCSRPTIDSHCPDEFENNCDPRQESDHDLSSDKMEDEDDETDDSGNQQKGDSKDKSKDSKDKSKNSKDKSKEGKDKSKDSKDKSGTGKSKEKSEKTSKDTSAKSSEKDAHGEVDKEEQIMACCKAQGMDSDCLDICSYDVDSDIGCRTDCANEFKIWMYCASNEEDNRDCCKKNEVLDDKRNKHCLEFCEGKVPKLSSIFGSVPNLIKHKPCIQQFDHILQCHKDNSPDEDKTSKKKWKNEGKIPKSSKDIIEQLAKC